MLIPVSYTHLDVYKRQLNMCVCVCVYIDTRTRKHTRAPTHTHIYICMYMNTSNVFVLYLKIGLQTLRAK